MEQGTLRFALRHRTRRMHGRLDDLLSGPHGQVRDLPGYVRLVRTLHALHASADRPLARWAASSPLATSLTASALPDREPLYAADLGLLGEHPVGPARSDGVDTVSDARGLALLYLVTGSAVGARVLLRGLPASVPQDTRRGLTDAAAPASTELWRDTCTLLGGDLVPAGLHEPAAVETLAVMEWLVGRAELVAS